MSKDEDIILDEIMNEIYRAYGSDSGVVFGISPNLRPSIKAIVKLVLQQYGRLDR